KRPARHNQDRHEQPGSVNHEHRPPRSAGKIQTPKEVKPEKVAAVPVPNQSPRIEGSVKPVAEAVQPQEPTPKVSVLQRLLQRFFGKPAGK
ncbi:MAG TPA: hypothetical protein DER60_00540, partial [Syntrophomonas sp.]|nr:hypothetical protein [Syntrophomonas sp.]